MSISEHSTAPRSSAQVLTNFDAGEVQRPGARCPYKWPSLCMQRLRNNIGGTQSPGPRDADRFLTVCLVSYCLKNFLAYQSAAKCFTNDWNMNKALIILRTYTLYFQRQTCPGGSAYPATHIRVTNPPIAASLFVLPEKRLCIAAFVKKS